MIRTWRDPWIPRGPTFRPITPKRQCRLNHVSQLLNEDRSWNVGLLQQHFWLVDVANIRSIKTSARQQEYFVAWQPELKGCFTVRSAYKLAMEEHEQKFSGGASSSNPDGVRSVWRMFPTECVSTHEKSLLVLLPQTRKKETVTLLK